MIVPNTQRVLIKPISIEQLKDSGIIIPGQLKAGENLLFGKVVHGGDTKFHQDQEVYYSEYSAARVFDYKSLSDGTRSLGDVKKEELVVVAADDVMAYDTVEVPKTTK